MSVFHAEERCIIGHSHSSLTVAYIYVHAHTLFCHDRAWLYIGRLMLLLLLASVNNDYMVQVPLYKILGMLEFGWFCYGRL